MVDPRDSRRAGIRDAEVRPRARNAKSDFFAFTPGLSRRNVPAVEEEAQTPASPSRSCGRLQAMMDDPLGTFADVTLESAAGERRIRCHRSVLCTYEYFRNAFGPEASFLEAERKVLRFEDISGDALDALVDYMYERDNIAEAEISVALELWRMAHVHFFADLKGPARCAVVEGLERLFEGQRRTTDLGGTEGLSFVVETLREATVIGDAELIAACSRLFFTKCGRWQIAEKAQLLLPLTVEEIKALQSYPAVSPGLEGEWTLIALHWVHHDRDARQSYAGALMQELTLDSLSGTALAALGERAAALREGGGCEVLNPIDDSILRSLVKKMRKLEAELEAISHCPEAVRAADLVRRDERDKRNRCVIS